MTRPTTKKRAREQGIALVMALFAVTALLMGAASALLVGMSNIRTARNARGASQVHYASESGITDALQAINAVGVVNFQNDVVGQWPTLFGAQARTFALSGFTYTVSATANAGNPANVGRLLAVATGPEGVSNATVANVLRSNIPSTSPGAIYLATDQPTDATFNGNAFLVDGNDHNYTGGAGPNPPVPAISTRNATNTSETVASLSSQQDDNVLGAGFSAGPPMVPSVSTSGWAPTTAEMNQMITDLLAKPGVVTNTGTQINGNSTFGTTDAPQITYFNANGGVTIKGNGNASGAGIMVVDGDLTIQGTFKFKGLVLVRGRTNVQSDPSLTDVTGNATVYGAVWTQDVNLVVGGSALVLYSSQALALANQVGGGGALPAPLVVTSLVDCGLLPPATGGCP
jgi:hypothetical protein